MSKLCALLSLTRFAGLAGGFVAIPYIGPALGIIGSLIGLVFSFLRWLLKDIEDAFREPPRLLVRLTCLIAVLAVGVWQGIKWDAHKVEKVRAEIAQMTQAWKDKDDEDRRKAAAARAAREEAERKVAEELAAPPPAVRVQPKRKPASPPPKPESSLFGGFPSLFGAGK